jgi:hypothetical protein
MLTAANKNFRSKGGDFSNFYSSASSVERISQEIYSKQAIYIYYTWKIPADAGGLTTSDAPQPAHFQYTVAIARFNSCKASGYWQKISPIALLSVLHPSTSSRIIRASSSAHKKAKLNLGE